MGASDLDMSKLLDPLLQNDAVMATLIANTAAICNAHFLTQPTPPAQVRDVIVDACLLVAHYRAGAELPVEDELSLVLSHVSLLVAAAAAGGTSCLLDGLSQHRQTRRFGSVSDRLAAIDEVQVRIRTFHGSLDEPHKRAMEFLYLVAMGKPSMRANVPRSVMEMPHYAKRAKRLGIEVAAFRTMLNAIADGLTMSLSLFKDTASGTAAFGLQAGAFERAKRETRRAHRMGVATPETTPKTPHDLAVDKMVEDRIVKERYAPIAYRSLADTISVRDHVEAVRDAARRLVEAPTGLRQHSPCLYGPDGSVVGRVATILTDLTFVMRERRRLFGESLEMRYEYGWTAIGFLLRAVRIVPGSIRVALDGGNPIGFVAVYPLTDKGCRMLTTGQIGLYDLLGPQGASTEGLAIGDLLVLGPGQKAAALVIQNFVHIFEEADVARKAVAIDRLHRLVDAAVVDYLDLSVADPEWPHLIARDDEGRGRAFLEAIGFRGGVTSRSGVCGNETKFQGHLFSKELSRDYREQLLANRKDHAAGSAS